jgi:hypothetical protein
VAWFCAATKNGNEHMIASVVTPVSSDLLQHFINGFLLRKGGSTNDSNYLTSLVEKGT